MTKAITDTQYVKATLALKKNIEGAFIALAERLYLIRKNEMWEGSYNSYSEFLTELGVSDGQASKLVSIYELFVLEYGVDVPRLAGIGQKNLYSILSLCTDKKSMEKVFEDIKGLNTADVVRLSKEEIAGKHKHEYITYRMCTICNKTKRIYDTE